MSHKKAIYAGTFDPFTNGHLDVVVRSLRIFDEITIVLAKSPSKLPLFNTKNRMEMLNLLFQGNERIHLDHWDGLIVDFAKKHQVGTLIRGLRPTGDFEIEFQMASMNKQLYREIETVFLMTGPNHYFVSSTLVREIYHHKGDISCFVPEAILSYLENFKKDNGIKKRRFEK